MKAVTLNRKLWKDVVADELDSALPDCLHPMIQGCGCGCGCCSGGGAEYTTTTAT